MESSLWTKNPRVLLNDPLDVVPSGDYASAANSTRFARLVIYTSIVMLLVTGRPSSVIIGAVSLLALSAYQDAHTKEGFATCGSSQPPIDGIDGIDLQAPTRNNPLMNVLLTDYVDDKERPPAAPAFNPIVESDINEKALDSQLYPGTDQRDDRSRLFQDLGDELAFDQSMRNFYAMPNTTIPNAQDAFAKYCYGTMPSCKDGDGLQCWNNVNSLHTHAA